MGEAELFLDLGELLFGMPQRIADRLPGDAQLCGDLGEGQILLLIEREHIALPVCQERTVAIKEPDQF